MMRFERFGGFGQTNTTGINRGFGSREYWCSKPNAEEIFIKAIQFVVGAPSTGQWDADTHAAYLAWIRQKMVDAWGVNGEHRYLVGLSEFGVSPESVAGNIVLDIIFPDDEATFEAISKPFLVSLGFDVSSYARYREDFAATMSSPSCTRILDVLRTAIVVGLRGHGAKTLSKAASSSPWIWVLGISVLGVLGYFVLKGR